MFQGKNSVHAVGLDERDGIVLRQKWSRSEVAARFGGTEDGRARVTL
jgi:hypothetical protein